MLCAPCYVCSVLCVLVLVLVLSGRHLQLRGRPVSTLTSWSLPPPFSPVDIIISSVAKRTDRKSSLLLYYYCFYSAGLYLPCLVACDCAAYRVLR